MADAILFGRTQNAFQTPFESQPERLNGYTSKTVQEAIEETLALAISNDRFVTFPYYNGNANTGRWLEFFPGISSDIAPLDINVSAKCLFINAKTTAASATCTIGFYNIVMLYTVTFSAQKEVNLTGTALVPLFTLPTAGELGIKIDSGSINRPHLIVALSATL
jgi:hypothetical protein